MTQPQPQTTPGIGHNGGPTIDAATAAAYVQDSKQELEEAALKRLTRLVEEQVTAEADIARLEAQLQEAKDRLKDVSEARLPSALKDLGLTAFTTETGHEAEIEEHIHGSIPKEKKDNAHKFLEDRGDDGLIKREFIISFGRDEAAWAKKFQRDLQQRKKPVACEIKEAVNAQTLKAWIRKRLAEGVDLPDTCFSIHRSNVTKVTVKNAKVKMK